MIYLSNTTSKSILSDNLTEVVKVRINKGFLENPTIKNVKLDSHSSLPDVIESNKSALVYKALPFSAFKLITLLDGIF